MADIMEKIFVMILAVIGLQIVASVVVTALLNLTGIASTIAGFITVLFALGILRLAMSIGK